MCYYFEKKIKKSKTLISKITSLQTGNEITYTFPLNTKVKLQFEITGENFSQNSQKDDRVLFDEASKTNNLIDKKSKPRNIDNNIPNENILSYLNKNPSINTNQCNPFFNLPKGISKEPKVLVPPIQIQDKKPNDRSYDLMEIEDNVINEDTFSYCVFVSGLSPEKNNLSENSDDYPAMCGHKECSLLKSFTPSILSCYEKESCEIKASHLTAQMTFPVGIKLCFVGKDPLYNNHIKKYDTYMNLIKNEKGNISYMISKFYYRKFGIKDYEKIYKINPLKEFTKFEEILKTEENETEASKKQKQKKMEDILPSVSLMISKESILIPECISIISKYPYISQIEICLDEIIKISKDKETLVKLINLLINEIPIPSKNQTLLFYLPTLPNPLEIYSPKNPYTNYLINYSAVKLLASLSIDNIIFIFHLLLCEQKILFIDNDYRKLSEISYLFIHFLYPLTWVNTYIPVLSFSTVQFLQSIVPFVMGIDEYLLNYSFKKQYIDKTTNIVFVHLSKNILSLSSGGSTIKSRTKSSILKELKLPEMPSDIVSFLEKNLKSAKKITFQKVQNEEIKNCFLTALIMMIGDYNSHIFFTDEDIPIFDSGNFLKEKQKKEKAFYTEIISTQIFNQFLYNEKLYLCSKSSTQDDKEIIDTGYFYKKLNKFKVEQTEKSKAKKEKTAIRSYSQKKLRILLIEKNKDISSNNKSHISPNPMDSNNENSIINSNSNSRTGNYFNIFPKRRGSNNSVGPSSVVQSQSHKENQKERPHLKENYKKQKYLIPPFFISNSDVKVDMKQITKFIYEQNNLLELNTNTTILNYTFTIPKIKESSGSYIFPKKSPIIKRYNSYQDKKRKEEKNDADCIRDDFRFSCTTLTTSNVEKQGFQPLPRTNPQKLITEWFINLISEKKSKTFKIFDMKPYLRDAGNRKLLASLLMQSSILDDNSNKMLNSYSFDQILLSIKAALYYIKSNEFNVCKLLTLSLFSYYKTEGKIIFLYEEYIKKYNGCKLWVNAEMWVNWYNEDICEKEKDNDSDSSVGSIDAIEKKMLFRLANIMKELKLSQNFIFEVISNQLGYKYLGEEDQKEIEEYLKNYFQ